MRKYKENPHDRNNWSSSASKEIKERTMKFKLRMILIFVMIFILMILFGGCITKKGNKLGGGFVKGEDGVYRRTPSAQTITPAPPVKSKPAIPIKSTYDPPNTDIIKESALPSHSPIVVEPQPAGELPPTKIEPRKKINLGLITIELPEDEGETLPTTAGTEPSESETTTTTKTEGANEVKVHWAELFLFYLNSAVVLCFIYVVYKLIRGEIQWKEPQINKHIKSLGAKKNVKRKTTKRAKKVSK